jgi:hypothetical protein
MLHERDVYVPANGIDTIPLGCARKAPGTTLTPQRFQRVNDAMKHPPNWLISKQKMTAGEGAFKAFKTKRAPELPI